MMIARIFHFAETTPDAIAIHRHGQALSYRAFADAIGSARTAFAERGVAALIVDDLQAYWAHALALSSLGLTTIALREPGELDELDLPDLRFVVDAGEPGTSPSGRARPGVEAVPPPSLRDPPSRPTAREMQGAGHILFSSGTTGRKKMLHCDLAAPQVGNVDADATMVYHVFDYGPWTLAGFGLPRTVWTVGGAVLIHQRDGHHAALRDLRGTHATLVPHTLNDVLAAPEDAFPRNERLQLFVGGGTVPWSQIEEVKRRITPNVFNAFASTEAAAIAITRLDGPEDHRWHRPLPGRRVEVVDDDGTPVPHGRVGQLRVAFESGQSAYVNDPAATATFFKGGFFHPGDLAIMREDGRFSLHGRVTDVVNLHGSKISPVAFEAMIEERLGLGPCCVASAPDGAGIESLYVVVENPAFLEPETVAHVCEALTEFFGGTFSGQILVTETLPRTDTGKVIRKEVQALIARMVHGPRI